MARKYDLISCLLYTSQGNGIDKTVKTENGGQIQVDNLMPGVYTVTEQE